MSETTEAIAPKPAFRGMPQTDANGKIIYPDGEQSPWAKDKKHRPVSASAAAAAAVASGQAIDSDIGDGMPPVKIIRAQNPSVINPFGNIGANGVATVGRDGMGLAREAELAGITTMQVLSYIMDAQFGDIDKMMEQIILRKRGVEEVVNLARTAGARLGMDRTDPSLNRFYESTMDAAMMEPAGALPILWFGLYENSFHMINGMKKAGKSSMLYNIAMHLAAGQDLWGHPIKKREKIFYFDPENDTARKARMERISAFMGVDIIPGQIFFNSGINTDLSDPRVMRELGDYLFQNKFTGLIIDPLANMFATANENDNSEAIKQGKMIIDLCLKNGVWVLAAHHMGNSANGARGATAREGIARVVFDLVLPEEMLDKDDEFVYGAEPKLRQDEVRLHCRLDGIGQYQANSLYLKMRGDVAQDCFTPITYRDWAKRIGMSNVKGENKTESAIRTIEDFFRNRNEIVPRQELRKKLKEGGLGETSIDAALTAMSMEGGEKQTLKMREIPSRGQKAYGFHRMDWTPTPEDTHYKPDNGVDPVTGEKPKDTRSTNLSADKGGVIKRQTDDKGVTTTTVLSHSDMAGEQTTIDQIPGAFEYDRPDAIDLGFMAGIAASEDGELDIDAIQAAVQAQVPDEEDANQIRTSEHFAADGLDDEDEDYDPDDE